MQRSNEDPNLFFSISHSKYTIILLYVNDIIITGDDNVKNSNLKLEMMRHFKMTNLGKAHYYIGVELF